METKSCAGMGVDAEGPAYAGPLSRFALALIAGGLVGFEGRARLVALELHEHQTAQPVGADVLVGLEGDGELLRAEAGLVAAQVLKAGLDQRRVILARFLDGLLDELHRVVALRLV